MKKNLCPKCGVGLIFIPNCPTGWGSEHLACPECDGTFNEGDGTYVTIELLPNLKVKMPDGTPFNEEPMGVLFYPDGWFDKIDKK